MIKNKKILIVGAGGFIGGHLVKYLKNKGYWVRGIDLKYNETVLILRNSGWTENCPGDFLTVGQTTDLFGDLARSLAENFNEIKLSN